jgi:hypothetical protein
MSILELTGAYLSPSFEDDAAWGWWNPSKYDVWNADDDSSFDLADLRFMVPFEDYSVFLAAERFPDLSGNGIQYDEDGSVLADQQVEVGIDTYDLVLAQDFRLLGGDLVRPWIGVTYMLIDERRIYPSAPETADDRADSKLWGAAVGLDSDLVLPRNLVLSVRLAARWATGDRDATFTSEESYGLPEAAQVQASDSVDRVMWGGELGLRWGHDESFAVEGGWRYRDWTYDDGPGSFSGAYLRLILRL